METFTRELRLPRSCFVREAASHRCAQPQLGIINECSRVTLACITVEHRQCQNKTMTAVFCARSAQRSLTVAQLCVLVCLLPWYLG
jgi:hypothetical protein